MNRRDEHRDAVFTCLTDHPTGITLAGIVAELDMPRPTARTAIRDLRKMFKDDEFTVIVDIIDGTYFYRFAGALEQAKAHVARRILDTETRVETQVWQMQALVNGTDARTINGKKARKILKALSRLQEDLQELGAEPSLFD